MGATWGAPHSPNSDSGEAGACDGAALVPLTQRRMPCFSQSLRPRGIAAFINGPSVGGAMRVAVLLEDRCQPRKCNDECWAFCPPVRNGIECIILDDRSGKPHVSESLCIGCGICVNKCPHDALIITQLPEELASDMTHRYGENGFRLFRMPVPKPDQVVGLLGPNGMGKSTALNVLSGQLTPNLGDWTTPASWEAVLSSLPAGELKDTLAAVADGDLRVAVKPQHMDKLPKVAKGAVGQLLQAVDARGEREVLIEEMGLGHLLERDLGQLSGGELQRVAIAATLLKDADIYCFDEPTSYLDIHERVRVSRLIQRVTERARVLVIEHDLAILDLLCDLVHIVYGTKAAYGILTPARQVRTGINAYLEGFLKEENVRIRDRPISFHGGRVREAEQGGALLHWDGIEKQMGDFRLTTGDGKLHQAEVVGVVGPNGTGKTTLARVMSGELDPDAGWVTMAARVSYKAQHVAPDFAGTVGEWLDVSIGARWRAGEFHVNVVRPLGVHELVDLRVKRLSGGEVQAVEIVRCLGTEADLYLLDEPSAHLDANARMEAAKAIRRTMESNEKSAFVIDHDIYFIDIVSDSLLVFEGEGGVQGTAVGPLPLRQGMNRFLKQVGITFRRDHDSKRPRINKVGSRLDREQRAAGEYFYT